MVLVAGSKLIDDVRVAPNDVLSAIEPAFDVRYHVIQRAHADEDHLVHSTRIHDRLIELERPVPYGYYTF
jgi:hypothetical protein